MTIMFLIFSFNVGGIERLLIDMANDMSKRGNDITLCIINDDYDSDLLKNFSSEVNIIKLARHPGDKRMFGSMVKLSKLIKKKNISILHCQGINCVLFSSIAKMFNPNMKVINTVHDVGNYPSYSNMKIFFQNLFLDKTIAISHTVENQILEKINEPDKVVTIYNAIDISKFNISNKPFTTEHIVIGNVARFYPSKKGQDVMVNALPELKRKFGNDIKCLFVGGVAKGQEKEYTKILRYVKDNELEQNAIFLGNVDDIPLFLSEIDIFVLPSRYEGFGIALIEALASGIPIVASDIDGPREIFDLAQDDGANIGLLAQNGNSYDFADKISQCISHHDEYDKNQMRLFVERNFSIVNMVDQHLMLYRELLQH